jgi:predicted exporter
VPILDKQNNNRLFPAICWGILIFICIIYSYIKITSGSNFESNVLGLLPDKLIPIENKKVSDQLKEQMERRFIILLKGESRAEGLKLAKILKDQIQKIPGVTISEPDSRREKKIKDFYFPFRQQLLSRKTRNQLLTLSPNKIANNRLQELYSPARSYSPYQLGDDPFNLGGNWIQSIASFDGRFDATEIPSVTDKKESWYLIYGELQRSPFEMGLQNHLLSSLDNFKKRDDSQKLEILTSGLVFHAAYAARVAQSEISTVGFGSLLTVVLLVLIIFRSIKNFFFVLLTLTVSSLFAISVTWLFFDKVHLVTIAFGSTLLGLAADYSFHFLIKMRATGSALKARKILLKGLILSCISSVMAYLLQLFSPFPGLQQFAIFVSSGLVAGCITVLIFGVLYRPSTPTAILGGGVFRVLIEPTYRRVAGLGTWISVFILAITVLAILNLYQQGLVDDVRLLNTSGSQLIDSERRTQQLLGSFSGQRYFLIEGQSSQQVLERVELLEEYINGKSQNSADQVLISPTSVVPSLQQQKSDYRLIQNKIFSKKGAMLILCKALQSDCKWANSQPKFNPELSPNNIPKLLAALSPSVGLLKNNVAVVFLRDTSFDSKTAMTDLHLPGIAYVDQVENLTSILKNYRLQVTYLLGAFYVFLVIFSLFLFSRKGIIVIVTATFSSIIALSLSAGTGITLFHILALLLVIGISIDTAIFFITPGLDQETWTASTLACFTSVIAFGLLSLSQIPFLEQFGSVVFIGLICAWLIAPLIYYLVEHFENQKKD